MNKKLIASTAAILTLTAVVNTTAAAPQMQTADQERVYALASVSKVYVTTAIMQLKDQGKIDIDAPVTDYIPEFTMADERYKDITVRMLMNPPSGIMGSNLRNEFLFGDNDKDKYDYLLENLKTQTLKADPGAYAAYCNDGFTLLEIIVERVSGMDFTSYIEENIAAPLNLTQTGTALNADELGTLVDIYSNGLNYDYEYCMALGSGGVYATASDVANFGASFWTGNDVLLSEESKDEMGTMWNEDAYENYMDTCGLGWDYAEQIQYEQAGVHVVGKGGDLQTMHSFLAVAPDNDISVCVLMSGGSSTLASLMCQNLMDIALEEQGIVVDPIEMPDVQTVDAIPEEFEQYEGYYTMYGTLANVAIDDVLTITVYTANGRTTEKKYMYTEEEMERRINHVHRDIILKNGFDILVTHAPAKGYGDMQDLPHQGFACFNKLMDRYHPKYMVHGHIHACYGNGFVRSLDHPSGTTIINAYNKYYIDIKREEYPAEGHTGSLLYDIYKNVSMARNRAHSHYDGGMNDYK